MSERWRMACGSRLAPKKQGSPWLSNIESGRCSECSFIPSRSSRSRGVYSLATFCLSPDCRSNRHWLRIGKNRRYPQIPVLFCPRVPGESASVSVRLEIVCFLGCRAGCGLGSASSPRHDSANTMAIECSAIRGERWSQPPVLGQPVRCDSGP